MITDKECQEIRTILNKAKTPFFIFDDDPDGLCSFLLLQAITKKGTGFPYKGHLKIGEEEILRVLEKRKPDLLVILDKPIVEQEFVDHFGKEIIHIDHHPPITTHGAKYHYYNPRKENYSDDRSTSYWAYKVARTNQWIAAVGCISDWFIPEFLDEFREQYPLLLPTHLSSPGQAIFDSPFGELVRVFSFGMKGKREDVLNNLDMFLHIETPQDILERRTPQGKFLAEYTEKMYKRYKIIEHDALQTKIEDNILLYIYTNATDSFTSMLSNELAYKKSESVIIIGRVKNSTTMLSIRAQTIKLPDIIHKALEGLNGYGGGHDHACGAVVSSDDFSMFVERFKKLVSQTRRRNNP